MLRWLKCLIGLHDWRIASEIDVPGSGYTDLPMDYECGGVDYIIRCAHCPRAYVHSGRGAWVAPQFPRYQEPIR